MRAQINLSSFFAFITLFVPLWCAAQVEEEVRTGNAETIAFVAVSDDDLRKFGSFPFDRRLTVELIESLKKAGASAIVMKFFFDTPTPSDERLSRSIASIPVLIQEELIVDKRSPEQETLPKLLRGRYKPAITSIHKAASDIGFVNARLEFSHDRIEIQAQVNDRLSKSLVLLAAELATQSKATINEKKHCSSHQEYSQLTKWDVLNANTDALITRNQCHLKLH